MADHVIKIKIPEEKLQKALNGFLALHPNIEVTYSDKEDEPAKPKYTNKQWVEEVILRRLKQDIKRGLELKAHKEVNVEYDDDVATIEKEL